MTPDKQKIVCCFAAAVKQLRQQRGMSLRQLAAASALEYSLVQRIEKGRVNFAFTTLVALAHGLGTTPSALLIAYEANGKYL